MRILIEEHSYSPEDLGDSLCGLDCLEDLSHKVSICYVGYFYNKELQDCVFILPKVLMRENGDRQEKVFGKYRPEDIINISDSNCPLNEEEKRFLYSFAVWIYRSIVVYKEKNPQNTIVKYKAQTGRKGKRKSYTLIDVILTIIRFAIENANFVATTLKTVHSGRNRTNWHKTVNQNSAIFQDGTPIYLNTIGKRRGQDFDDELFVIFYSILGYINDEYGFYTPKGPAFNLIRKQTWASYMRGRGRKRLRQIKYRYYSDKALRMWELCDAFFDEHHNMLISQGAHEYLLAKDFNIAFEAMIDELIGDKDLPDGLKNQADGKMVDHMYHWNALTASEENVEIGSQKQTIYIGDSKYYKIGHKIGRPSVSKQFTYARNVIQWTIDVFNDKVERPYWIKNGDIRDDRTEGYAIIPNFFISAKILEEEDGAFKLGKAGYTDSSISQSDSTEKQPIKLCHFKNRLFDRDTLFVFHYDVNFLHVIYLYARNKRSEKEVWKNEARQKFREDIQQTLNEDYEFYAALPHPGEENYLDMNFRRIAGKVFTPYADKKILSLALENGDTSNAELLIELRNHFFIAPIKLGDAPYMALDKELGKPENKVYTLPQQDCGIIIGYYKNDNHLSTILRTRTYYMRASVLNEIALNGFRNIKYLLLHKGSNRKVYDIDTLRGIKVVYTNELEEMGYSPSEDGAYVMVHLRGDTPNTVIDLSSIAIAQGHAGAITRVVWI